MGNGSEDSVVAQLEIPRRSSDPCGSLARPVDGGTRRRGYPATAPVLDDRRRGSRGDRIARDCVGRGAAECAGREPKGEDREGTAAKSVELLGQKGGIDKAILLAVLAWRLSPTDEARSALETLGSASFDVAKILGQHTSNGIESLAFSQAGAALLLATGGGDGLIMLWRIPAGTAAGPPIASGQKYVEELQFSDSGSYLLSRGASPEPSEGTKQDSIVLHDLKSGTMKLVPTEPVFGKQYSWEGAMSVSPDGQLVAFFFGNKLAIWNAATNTVRQKVVGGGEYLIGVYFATNSRLVFVLGPYGYGFHSGFGAGTWDLENDQMRFGPLLNSPGVDRGSRAVFSKDGSRIATWGFNGGHVLLYASHKDMSLQPMQLPGKVRMQGDIRLSRFLRCPGQAHCGGRRRKGRGLGPGGTESAQGHRCVRRRESGSHEPRRAVAGDEGPRKRRGLGSRSARLPNARQDPRSRVRLIRD